jgi:hypothetical protein
MSAATTGPAGRIRTWWHGVAALPADRTDHAYHALRRVWGDHTMAGGRGFYRTRSEDHVTVALFHLWALFPDASWAPAFLEAVGAPVAGAVGRVRWAYACEEVLDARLRPHHGRDFVIADIILTYEDEAGVATVSIEAKPPGKAAEPGNARKLLTYTDLPSLRGLSRRSGCLLVGAGAVERSRAACGGTWPVLSWEELAAMQVRAVASLGLPADLSGRVAGWIARHHAACGVHPAGAGAAGAPAPFGAAYASADSLRRIAGLDVPDSVRRFLMSSECVEAARDGLDPDPPMPWLAVEPDEDDVRAGKRQSTADRRVVRWSFDWSPMSERTWR